MWVNFVAPSSVNPEFCSVMLVMASGCGGSHRFILLETKVTIQTGAQV
jgi:hypothetical protein